MSGWKHGLFTSGFRPCDRCTSNAKCKDFKPAGRCVLEQTAFEGFMAELTEQYDLDGAADRLSAERAGMYLIRIARVEEYDASVGINETSPLWGTHIAKMDNMLRGYLNDLAVSRENG